MSPSARSGGPIMASPGGSCRAEGETDEGNGIRLFPILVEAVRTLSRSPHPALRATFPQGKALRAHAVRPYIVVASSTSLASAYGESSLIPLLRLSPPNPRLPPLGFGGGPINS